MSSKIQAIRETLKGGYIKPDKSKLDVFIQQLKEYPEVQDYLTIKRGLSKETIEHFKLGYDKEKNAIAIPVFKKGELVNIRYRFIDDDGGQKYTQEKGCEVWVYNEDGISKAMNKGAVMIVEGEFDLMSCWQAGFKSVISPASGKDSYGPWIEMLDNIPKIYIAYDNDKPGKSAAINLATRIGIDKCLEVQYPDDVKDANEFFTKHTREDFIPILQNAKPYYKYKFKGVGDIIESLRIKKDNITKLDTVPFIEWEDDWVAILSGVSNVGKTSYVLNIASELAKKDIPTLVMPFERGIRSVGKRFLQVMYSLTLDDMSSMDDARWIEILKESANMQLYFSVPNLSEFEDIIKRAKKLFNIQFCIIDHLDYFVRGQDRFAKQADMIEKIKTLAQEYQIRFIVVHHLNKTNQAGSFVDKRPTMDDLKGSSDLFQIPEAVILLYKPEEGKIEVIIDKNKGKIGFEIYDFDYETGRIYKNGDMPTGNKEIDDAWADDF